MNVADHLAERFVRLGVRCVFGVGGANIEDVFTAVQRRRPAIRAVQCKHEHGAGTAADAYARIDGGLGVVLVSSGGGALNLVASLAEARASRVPLLAVIGDPPTQQQGLGAFQDTSAGGEVDALAVHRPVSVWQARGASAGDVPGLLDQAIAAALTERGPAVLVLAKDLQSAPLDPATPLAGPLPAAAHAARPHDQAALAAAMRLLARGPVVVIAGDEVARSGAQDALTWLVETLDAEVVVTPDARDAFDNLDVRFLGVAGAMGHARVACALRHAGAAVLVGTCLPLVARAGLEDALAALPIVGLGLRAPFVASAAGSLHLPGELRLMLGLLADRAERDRPIGKRAPSSPFSLAPVIRSNSPEPSMPLAAIGAMLNRRLEPGTVVLADAGNTGAAVVHHVRCPRGGRWLVAMGMAGMGYTYGAAIGAACASERHVVAVSGDGAFYMHGFEVHTALEQRLPVTWFVLDNRAHGMGLVRERILLGEHAGYNAFGPAQLAHGLAAMFPGLPTFSCTTLGDVDRALAEALAMPGPAVVVATLDAVEIPPLSAFRTALDAGMKTVPRTPP